MLTLGDNDGPVSDDGQSVWQRLPQRARPKAKGRQWESVQSSKHTYVPTCQRPASESPSVRSTGPPSRSPAYPTPGLDARSGPHTALCMQSPPHRFSPAKLASTSLCHQEPPMRLLF